MCFNKTDLLKEKIASGKSPVSHYFPEYKEQGGADEDYDAVVEFFTVSLCSSLYPKIFMSSVQVSLWALAPELKRPYSIVI